MQLGIDSKASDADAPSRNSRASRASNLLSVSARQPFGSLQLFFRFLKKRGYFTELDTYN
jgi:hypothetical protein